METAGFTPLFFTDTLVGYDFAGHAGHVIHILCLEGSLCITPHYLSEISKSISGQSATYWIDRFVTAELSRLLILPDLPLESIADRMNFSSVSYLSRYVKSKLGVTPSEYRSNFRR